MKFGRPDYDGKIVWCDVARLRTMVNDLLGAFPEGYDETKRVYREELETILRGPIPEDEPVFLTRGQDAVGYMNVHGWALLHQRNGGCDNLYEEAMLQAQRMEAWPIKQLADARGRGVDLKTEVIPK